jgi:hypothetical protein
MATLFAPVAFGRWNRFPHASATLHDSPWILAPVDSPQAEEYALSSGGEEHCGELCVFLEEAIGI